MPDFGVLSDLFSAISDIVGGFATFVGSVGGLDTIGTTLGSAAADPTGTLTA